jgi:hypothetical protein
MAALRVGLVVTTLLDLTGATLAQERMLGTLSAEAQPVFKDGRLNGCSVVFGALARDFTYRQGAYITVNGSFGIMSAKGELGTMLKVVVHDTDPRTNRFIPSPPASAYFISGTKTTKSAVGSVSLRHAGGNIRGALECAPGAGQDHAAVLTLCRAW